MPTTANIDDILARARRGPGDERPLTDRPWLVYGCGSTGRAWAQALARAGAEVRAFVDRDAPDQQALPVLRPVTCPASFKTGCSLLIGLHNPGVDIGAVRAELQALGFAHVVLLQELVARFPERSHFWLAPAAQSLPAEADILAAHAALADDASRHLFAALLDQRLNAVAHGLPRPDPENAYLPPDLPAPTGLLRFVDCGAYTGDTIDNFRRLGHRFAAVAAFEPDPAHYPRLVAALASEHAAVFPCGVWNRMEQLRFTANDAASHIADDGGSVIQTLALDDALPGFAPTFIKMDIEGAEANALDGARKTIARHRPRLAISAYHRPGDLWDLLLKIRRWDLGYRFHLRSHSFNGFDTVLYALPAE
jgi:FkbM family methyltransferase